RHLMIIKVGGAALNNLVDYPAGVKQRLAAQAEKITVAGILKAIELFIEAQETAKVKETLRMPLELAFAKLTYCGSAGGIAPVAPSAAVNTKPAVAMPAPAAKPQAAQPTASTAPKVTIKAGSLEEIKANWSVLTHEVSRRKMALATY